MSDTMSNTEHAARAITALLGDDGPLTTFQISDRLRGEHTQKDIWDGLKLAAGNGRIEQTGYTWRVVS